MRFFWIIFLSITLFCLQGMTQTQAITVTSTADAQYLKKILKQKKFTPRFINAVIKNYEPESFPSVMRLNMLGFLNPPLHSVLVTDEGVLKSEEFIEKNKKAFLSVERRDHVPASVIAALLWIETKHGRLTGKYHVLSAFGHMVQTTRKDVIKELTSLAIESEKSKNRPTKHLAKLLRKRAQYKSDWALEQLKALEKLHKKDKKMAEELLGSFAGAFGIPQFIPTSYWTYAKPLKTGKVADLYNPDDAISSVGNYLKKEGWNTKRKTRQMKALMHYNNSQDYAESILALSEKITASQQQASGDESVAH